jgi:acetyltransferase-like isoleucine patch superfamily enzyme
MPSSHQLRRLAKEEVGSVFRDLVLNRVIASALLPRKLRPTMLRRVGHHGVHPKALINPGVFLGSTRGLFLGERAFINYGCFLDLGAPITMGKDSGIGYQTMLITCGHDIGPAHARIGTSVNKPIHIGDGCWIGSRVTVLPGVTIGAGCVVASGSVVTRDCTPNSLYAGVPARLIRSLESTELRTASTETALL